MPLSSLSPITWSTGTYALVPVIQGANQNKPEYNQNKYTGAIPVNNVLCSFKAIAN